MGLPRQDRPSPYKNTIRFRPARAQGPPSRIAQTTSDWPRRIRRRRTRLGRRSDNRRCWRDIARGSSRRRAFSTDPHHRMHETHCQQHQLRLEFEFGAVYRLEPVVDLPQCIFHLAVCAREILRQHRVFALGAFGLAREVLTSRPVRPAQALCFFRSGGAGMISAASRQGSLPERGWPMQSEPVSPPADHHHMLASVQNSGALPSARLTRDFCCRQKSIAK